MPEDAVVVPTAASAEALEVLERLTLRPDLVVREPEGTAPDVFLI